MLSFSMQNVRFPPTFSAFRGYQHTNWYIIGPKCSLCFLHNHSVCSINLDSSKRIDACAIIRASVSLMESILLSNPQPIVYILLDVPVMYFYSCFSLEPDLIPDFSLQFHCIQYSSLTSLKEFFQHIIEIGHILSPAVSHIKCEIQWV